MPLLAPRRYKGAFGGRGSGKSHFFAGLMVETAYATPGFRGLCVREVQKSLRESAMRLIIDKIREYGLERQFEILEAVIRTPGDGILIFQGMQNHTADTVKSFEGFNVAWWEEAHTASEKALDLLRPTLRAPGSELWFSWNPTRQRDPVDRFFRKDPPGNAVSVEASWRDNPWFPDELREDMANDRERDPEKAAHVWDGGYQPAATGAYYGSHLVEVRRSGRIKKLPIDPALPVHTAWDLGKGGNMAVWLFQQGIGAVRVVAFRPGDHTAGIPTVIRALENEYPDVEWGYDFVPHDAKAMEIGSERTRVETLVMLGRKPRLVPLHAVDDGINAVKEILPICWFDEENCEAGLEALAQYRPDYNDDRQVYSVGPLHNWASHPADAFRYLAMSFREQVKPAEKPVRKMLPGQVLLPGPPEPQRGVRIKI